MLAGCVAAEDGGRRAEAGGEDCIIYKYKFILKSVCVIGKKV